MDDSRPNKHVLRVGLGEKKEERRKKEEKIVLVTQIKGDD